jgi:D-xylose transport system substrate-binding protein
VRTSRAAVLAAVVTLSFGAAACSGDGTAGKATTTTLTPGTTRVAATGKVGVILPDTESSGRWQTADRTFRRAFEVAGVEYDISNAEGDRTKMAAIADQMVADGAKVLVLVNLDSESGAAIEKKAAAAGVKSIDFDRLTTGGTADAFVSFDNVSIGELQGDGLIRCLEDKGTKTPSVAVLGGPPTDRDATLLAQGYNSRIAPKFDSGEWTLVDDKSVPGADQAAQVFEQMLTAAGGRIDGVLAADDDLADAAISVLTKHGLQVPVTGQGASIRGLQHILAGEQCMTVYKPVKAEADAAAAAAIAILQGQEPAATGTVDDGVRAVPAVLAPAVAVFKDNVKDVVADGSVSKEALCTAELAALCADAGIG